MLYGLLAIAVAWVVVRTWTSPVHVIALILTMHGLRQVAIAVLPQLAAAPYIMNLAVGGLATVALGLTMVRPGGGLPMRTLVRTCGIYVVFYAVYVAYAVAIDAFTEPVFLEMMVRIAPYVPLQVLATTALVGASSPQQLRGALAATSILCLLIIGIALTDSSIRADDSYGRLMLKVQSEQDQASNPLALADVGVMLTALMVNVLPGAVRATFPALSRIDWLSRAAGMAKVPLVIGIAVMLLGISRAEPILALAACLVTTFVGRGRRRLGIAVATLACLSAAAFTGVGESAFSMLVEWFPRLEKIDGDFEFRATLLEELLARYATGGFGTLLFGLGPGYSIAHFGLYPHNHVLESLVELGLVGLVFVAVGPATAWIRGATLVRSAEQSAFLGNARFFHTMLTFAILASMKRGSVVHPDTFMWGASLGLLHARAHGLLSTPRGTAGKAAIRTLGPRVPAGPMSPGRRGPSTLVRPRHAVA